MNETPIEQGENLPAVPNGAWGTEGTHQSDVLIPRIQLLQDMSKPVKDGKARAGVLLHSVTHQVLADRDATIEVIPLHTYREWVVEEVIGKQKKFLERVLITPENEAWTKEAMLPSGKLIERTKTLNFFVLLPTQLNDLPFLVTFKKSSMNAGRALSTHFQTCAMKKTVPPAATVFKLGAESRTWEGNSFYGFTVAPSRQSTSEEIAKAYGWYQQINKQAVKVDEDQDMPQF